VESQQNRRRREWESDHGVGHARGRYEHQDVTPSLFPLFVFLIDAVKISACTPQSRGRAEKSRATALFGGLLSNVLSSFPAFFFKSMVHQELNEQVRIKEIQKQRYMLVSLHARVCFIILLRVL